MKLVNQFVHSLVPNDAISNHAREVRSALNEMGCYGQTYVWESRGTSFREVSDFQKYRPGKNEVCLYQHATGSRIADQLSMVDSPLIVNYHNITPPDLFANWEEHVGQELEIGRRQLRELAPRSELGIAVSTYNQSEMIAAGYADTVVVPILFNVEVFDHQADQIVLNSFSSRKESGGADLLFVGRISPNKSHQDLIKAFVMYRQQYDPKARLHLVGTSASKAYSEALEKFIAASGAGDAVYMTGGISPKALAAYYQSADAFIMASEHEGFCVPLLEAMYYELPIVAYSSSAVPETAGNAALLLSDKSPAMFAAAINRVISDSSLSGQLIASGKSRLTDFDLTKTRKQFVDAVSEVIA